MPRQVSDKERAEIQQKARQLGGILIRAGRNYVAAVRAPSREENQQAEDRFCDALGDLVIAAGESGIFD